MEFMTIVYGSLVNLWSLYRFALNLYVDDDLESVNWDYEG